MSGIPRTRVLLYAALIIGLIGALWLRTTRDPADVAQAVARAETPIRVPELHVATSQEGARLGTRDIFRTAPKPISAPVVTAQPAQREEPTKPDPIEIAIEQAKKSLDAVKLIGVVASGEGALAVFEQDGNTHSRVVGDQIVSGFKLERISQGEIRARHERLGLVAVLSLGGVRPMQWTRVE